MHGRFQLLFALCLGAQLCLGQGRALAVLIGNPVPDFDRNNFGVGLSLSDQRETLYFDYGITDDGMLRVLAGNLSLRAGVDGTEVGAGYRHTLPTTFTMGPHLVRVGVLAEYRIGEVDGAGTDVDTSLLHIGGGAAFAPLTGLNVYAVAVYERTQADAAVPGTGSTGRQTDSDVGAALGAEYWISSMFVAGLEAHTRLADSDVVAFAALKF